MSIESVMLSKHLILCCPLLLLLSIFLSIRVFSSESAVCIRWPKYWRFSFNISPSNKYSGLISFSIVSFDLLAAQGTLKSLLQHQSLKASVLWHSAFFMVQLSHHYTGKAIALTTWIIGKVMCLLFNMLSMFVIAFSKAQTSLHFVTAVNVHSNFGPQGNKICHCFHFFLICLLRSDGTRCHDLTFFIAKF